MVLAPDPAPLVWVVTMWAVLKAAGTGVVSAFKWAWTNPLIAAGAGAIAIWVGNRLKARAKWLESRGRITPLAARLRSWVGDVGITIGTMLAVTGGVSSLVPSPAAVIEAGVPWYKRFMNMTGVPLVGF